jgi:hypothetical protein
MNRNAKDHSHSAHLSRRYRQLLRQVGRLGRRKYQVEIRGETFQDSVANVRHVKILSDGDGL